MQFKFRSPDKEMLDDDSINIDELNRNLSELDIINRFLGGYKASLKGFKNIMRSNLELKTILDIGTGGGETIKYMSEYSLKKNMNLFFYGLDLKQDCISYASKQLSSFNNVELICDDYRNLSQEWLRRIDIIHCSLFLHHLTSNEIVSLFKLARMNKCRVLANDLHRNWLAYYSIKVLTFLFSKSTLVKNDAPLSVLRGFTKKELIVLLKEAGFKNFSVKWIWPFRYVIIANE